MRKLLSQLGRKARRYDLTWRYLYNLAPTLAYKTSRREIDPEAMTVLSKLNREGVAMTSVDALLGSDNLMRELSDDVSRMELERDREIALARAEAADGEAGRKTFVYELLGERPEVDPNWIYARFALQKQILDIANAYVGMYTRLRYYNVWRTFAAAGQPRESQLWHRDREDRYILKLFVYLGDVPKEAGALTYVPGSHPKGRVRREPEYFLEGVVRRSTDEQMARVAPQDEWMTCAGVRGTMVFADTRGYHKGGLARTSDRLMYVCMFTSPASESREMLAGYPETLSNKALSTAYALASPRRGAWIRRPNQAR